MLLTSKISLPDVSDLMLDRERLTSVLLQSTNDQVISIVAPAGFGKTTLMASFIEETDSLVAWYSLDENDNEGRHFLAYLVESIHRATGNGIPRSRAIVEAKSVVDLRAVIAEMLEELRSLTSPLRIVFDDFHVIDNAEVEAAVKYLLKHAPAGIGFGFTSRSLPALGLASYRVSNRLLEINDNALALTADETADLLFKRLGFRLPEPALLQLQELSEGWAPLVQLFALSVDSESDVNDFLADFERGHSHLLDYLAEEVLDKLDDETRQVLARVSLLRRIDGDMAEQVSGSPRAREILESAYHRGLFLTPIDRSRTWFRFHPVFAKFLERSLSSSDRVAVHEAALKAWLALEDPLESLTHAVALKSVDSVMEIMERYASTLLLKGHYRTLARSFEFIGEARIVASPSLTILGAKLAQAQYEYDKVEHLLTLGERYIHLNLPEQWQTVEGAFATLRAQMSIARGNFVEAREYADEALQLLDESEIDHTVASLVMGESAFCLGRLNEAFTRMSELERRSRLQKDFPDAVWALSQQAEIAFAQGKPTLSVQCQNKARELIAEHHLHMLPVGEFIFRLGAQQDWESLNLERAKERINLGLAANKHLGESRLLQEYSLLANIALAEADKDACLTWLDKLGDLLSRERYHLDWIVNADYARLSIWEALGDTEAIEEWLDSALSVNEAPSNHFEQRHGRNVVRAMIALQRFADAGRLIKRLNRFAKQFKLVTELNKNLIIEAYFEWQQGSREASIQALHGALGMALGTGLRASFLRCGKPLILMLKGLIKDTELSASEADLAEQLIGITQRHREFDGRIRIDLDASVIEEILQSDQLPEILRQSPLTPREWQVFNLIHLDFSNAKIAEHFEVAPSTIKTHIRSLYQKLGVEDRAAAKQLAATLLLAVQQA